MCIINSDINDIGCFAIHNLQLATCNSHLATHNLQLATADYLDSPVADLDDRCFREVTLIYM